MAMMVSQHGRAKDAGAREKPSQHQRRQGQSKREFADMGAQPGQEDAKLRFAAEPRVAVGGEGSRNTKPVYLRLELSEVVAAVESLYADKLKPLGRILLKRVRERSASAMTAAARARWNASAVVDTDAAPLVDPRCLRRLCESCEWLRIEPEEGNEYSVLFIGRQHSFIDVSSLVDCYPVEMWAKASEYFEGLRGEEMMLPGGRYACAQVLTGRRLPFLAGYFLGEVCHIVQLAVSQKTILGYLGGNMVPFGLISMEHVKEQRAVWQQSVSAEKPALDMPLATWEEPRASLKEVLKRAGTPSQPGVINLPNVKPVRCSRSCCEFSQTALGHARLNEFVQDPHVGDICSPKLQGTSQFGVQRIHESDLAEEAANRQAAPWAPHFMIGAVAYELVGTVAQVCGFDANPTPSSPSAGAAPATAAAPARTWGLASSWTNRK